MLLATVRWYTISKMKQQMLECYNNVTHNLSIFRHVSMYFSSSGNYWIPIKSSVLFLLLKYKIGISEYELLHSPLKLNLLRLMGKFYIATNEYCITCRHTQCTQNLMNIIIQLLSVHFIDVHLIPEDDNDRSEYAGVMKIVCINVPLKLVHI
jgi:hypothetical protein